MVGRLSVGEGAKLGLVAPKRHKYGAKAATLDGTWFASSLERDTYADLLLRLRAGLISDLILQPAYPLIVNGVNCGKYVADFAFTEGDKKVALDAKGFPTPVYRLKVKIAKALYPEVVFREVRR